MEDSAEKVKDGPSIMDIVNSKYVDKEGKTFLDIITDNSIADLFENKFDL